MSPEQVTEPVTGSLDDELDQFAAVFTILGSLHYQVPDADHLHELLQMIDEWPLSRPPVTQPDGRRPADVAAFTRRGGVSTGRGRRPRSPLR